jgi:hypothetical protein
MCDLLIAFGCGALLPLILLLVLLRHHAATIESYETKIAAIEGNLLTRLGNLVRELEGKKSGPTTTAN